MRFGPRRWPLVLGLIAVVLGTVTTDVVPASAAQRQDQHTDAGRVLIVSYPRTTWELVERVQPPVLTEFMQDAAVASMSPRTVGRHTQPPQTYLTIGAGNRAAVSGAATAGTAAAVDELTSAGPAAEVFERRTGQAPSGEIVALNFAAQVNQNNRLLYGTVPGSLATALASEGLSAAAIGNAGRTMEDETNRDVALAAADESGSVSGGLVSSTLMYTDQLAPFGLRSDPEVYQNATELAWTTNQVLIVEMSDMERAEQARSESLVEQGDQQVADALMHSDEILGRLLGTVDTERDTVIVVSGSSPLETEQLLIFGMQGPGVDPGWARSATTRRAGYVTLTDIAPTVLAKYDIATPSSMYATPIVWDSPGAEIDQRMESMATANERAIFRDQATGPLTVGFIVLLAVMLGAVVWTLARRAAPPRWVDLSALMVLAVPTTFYLAGLLPYGPFSTVGYGLVVLAVSAALALAASATSRLDPVMPPLLLAGLCLAVLGLDVLTGGYLQLDTVFGYSPIVAGRFAGFGNQAFALFGICALVVATAGSEALMRHRPRTSRTVITAGVALLFLVVIVLTGAPAYGSDVGGVLASVPAFSVCVLTLRGVRINGRLAALIAVATVVVLGLFAGLDLLRPEESRTHLGRFVEKILEGEAPVILQRKLETNLNILTSTVWTLTIPVALIFFAYLAWKPNDLVRRIQEDHPTFRAFGLSALILGFTAFALNDSGVALPAMMLGVALPYTAVLAVGVLRRDRSATRASSPPTEPAAQEQEPLSGAAPR